jgi:predicted DNA-binding protein with PD1-like motif
MLRLKPHQDIKEELVRFTHENHLKNVIILSVVGSVSTMRVRIADGVTILQKERNMEVVHMSGTITQHRIHIHILGIDTDMQSFGGHLVEGTLVHTTLECALMELSDVYENSRVFDPETGYDELLIQAVGEKDKID